ncbi:unnamed protein product [Urochloa decumbens]|uniref:Uncharacterized protein n=1 Tax=Urochloa decumbens TaxID=240449 RepID=A0ABC8ZTB4_9POAL
MDMDWRARTDTPARTAGRPAPGPGVRPAATGRPSPCARVHELVPLAFHHALWLSLIDSVLVDGVGEEDTGWLEPGAARADTAHAFMAPPLFIRRRTATPSPQRTCSRPSLSPNRCRYSDSDAVRAQRFAGSTFFGLHRPS